MNAQPAEAGSGGKQAGRFWLLAFATVLLCLAAISRQSLWIDESLTAVKAAQPTLTAWWQEMQADKASDLQMPLYMIYVWGWAKIFGSSEWALRLANLPWFVAGLTVFINAVGRSKKISLTLAAFTASFAWYYLDEARPYAMQLGASLMIFAALYRLKQDEKDTASGQRCWVLAFCFGIIVLSGSSLLGMIWAGAACLGLPLFFPRARLIETMRARWLIGICSLGVLMLIGAYYLWTLKAGARASDVGRTDARNVGFIFYELFGFGGLGPGRLQIRDEGLRAFVPFAKQLAVYGALILDLMILGVWQTSRAQSRRTLLGWLVIIAAPVFIILSAGYVEHFRVLGRHFTPLLPVVLFLLGAGLAARWSRRHWASKPLAILFLILSLASCLSFRFAARHKKDDYRGAAAYAQTALQSGARVWWNAGREGAIYYQLSISEHLDGRNTAIWLMNPTPEMLSPLPAPEVVIVSKPDVYDAQDAISAYLKKNGYHQVNALPAFTLWKRTDGLSRLASNDSN